jgi:hypothetical protein
MRVLRTLVLASLLSCGGTDPSGPDPQAPVVHGISAEGE